MYCTRSGFFTCILNKKQQQHSCTMVCKGGERREENVKKATSRRVAPSFPSPCMPLKGWRLRYRNKDAEEKKDREGGERGHDDKPCEERENETKRDRCGRGGGGGGRKGKKNALPFCVRLRGREGKGKARRRMDGRLCRTGTRFCGVAGKEGRRQRATKQAPRPRRTSQTKSKKRKNERQTRAVGRSIHDFFRSWPC